MATSHGKHPHRCSGIKKSMGLLHTSKCFAKLQAQSSGSQTVDSTGPSVVRKELQAVSGKLLFYVELALFFVPSCYSELKTTKNTWKKHFSNITLPYQQEVQLSQSW